MKTPFPQLARHAGRIGWYWAVDYCPGPVIAILWLGLFNVAWSAGRFPRGLTLGWNRD